MTRRVLAGATLLGALAAMSVVTSVSAQQPQTVRLRGTIEKVDGKTVWRKRATAPSSR
jgi:hypothetical protein